MPAKTSQRSLSRNGLDTLIENDDGSVNICFGPETPEGAPEETSIDTVPDRDVFLILQLLRL